MESKGERMGDWKYMEIRSLFGLRNQEVGGGLGREVRFFGFWFKFF